MPILQYNEEGRQLFLLSSLVRLKNGSYQINSTDLVLIQRKNQGSSTKLKFKVRVGRVSVVLNLLDHVLGRVSISIATISN
jgi:hypothetical protein